MQIIDNMGPTNKLIKGQPVPTWNDNRACICWTKSTTTKGLKHIQIWEKAICKGVTIRLFKVEHIKVEKNPLDIFQKGG